MNVDYINAFIEATDELFNVMTTIKIVRGQPYLKRDQAGTYYISGVIGMAGESKGAVVLSFPRNLAINVVSNFLGEPITTMNQIVRDGVGELTNIILGGAKKRLVEKKYSFKISFPIVIIGDNHQIASRPEDIPCIVIPFSALDEVFALEVSLKKD